MYKVISSFKDYSLLLISLETGRKHQIRTQLSHNKIHIVGDVKYRGKYHTKDSIFLHSFYMDFNHPVGNEKVELITGYPDRFNDVFPDNGDISDKILVEIKDFT
jgi:23S rRNA pseudouridine1911/1915/1917 synthase